MVVYTICFLFTISQNLFFSKRFFQNVKFLCNLTEEKDSL